MAVHLAEAGGLLCAEPRQRLLEVSLVISVGCGQLPPKVLLLAGGVDLQAEAERGLGRQQIKAKPLEGPAVVVVLGSAAEQRRLGELGEELRCVLCKPQYLLERGTVGLADLVPPVGLLQGYAERGPLACQSMSLAGVCLGLAGRPHHPRDGLVHEVADVHPSGRAWLKRPGGAWFAPTASSQPEAQVRLGKGQGQFQRAQVLVQGAQEADNRSGIRERDWLGAAAARDGAAAACCGEGSANRWRAAQLARASKCRA